MGLTQITTGGVDDNINIDSNTLKVDGTNNRVGIGTTSPGKKLQVDSADFDTALFKRTTSTGSATIFLSNTSNHGAALQSLGNGAGGFALFTQTSNALSERLRIDSSGNVGIGTTSPDSLIHAQKSDFARLRLEGTNSTGTRIVDVVGESNSTEVWRLGKLSSSSSDFQINVGGTERLRIDSSGNVGIGTSTITEKLEVAGDIRVQNAVKFRADDGAENGAIKLLDDDEFAIESFGSSGVVTVSTGSSNSERLRIDSSGNVGIGTTSPDALLEIESSAGGTSFSINNTGTSGRQYILQSTSSSASIGGGKFAIYDGDAPAHRFVLDSSGNVGIGTSAVSFSEFGSNTGGFAVQNVGGSNTGIKIGDGTNDNYLVAAGNGNFYNSHYGSGSMIFGVGTSGTERMRIDSSGRLLVGTSSNRSTWFNQASTFNPGIQLEGTGGPGGQYMSITANHNASGYGARYLVGKTRGTAVGGTTVVQNNDEIGGVSFFGSDGSEMVEAANIVAYVDSPPGTNDMPGRIQFATTADGAAGPTERMRLDKDGSLNIGCLSNPTVNSAGPLHIFAENTKDAINIKSEHTGNVINVWKTNTGQLLSFYQGSSQGAVKGSISISTTNVAFNTSSDYRLKENVVALDGAITRVKQLQPKRFNFIVDADTTVDGFLAHEAQTVVPEAVTGTHNEVDSDNNPVYQGIDQSKLVPLLTAALQEAIAKIETLETKVAALEAAE